ncbi:hypothetical protein K2Y00_04140 [Patescibacteria group bacterium]|nr:hypothetical protein [Patescibacteria group bacterium]
MSKFLVLYLMPAEGLAEWMKIDPEIRKSEEEKMKADWDAWASAHSSSLLETAGAGKTKRITPEGVQDVANNIMLYSMVEAESTEAAAQLFEGHPHLKIPGGTIEVMPTNILPGMEKK